jgi:hypothetical protein
MSGTTFAATTGLSSIKSKQPAMEEYMVASGKQLRTTLSIWHG